ncbi:MAG: hypothetical protein R3C68_13455 [Myxococcota bacterium]
MTIPKSGDYIVWARVLAPSGSADSFFVSVNGVDEDIYDAAEGTWSAQWQWTRVNGRNGGTSTALNPRIFNLNAGLNTLTFRGREAGTGLDVIFVTNDASFVPTGLPCDEAVVEDGRCITACTPVAEICEDGLDNDCNGDVDAADVNCQVNTDVDVVCPENHIVVNPEAVRPDEFTVVINDKDGNPVTCTRIDANLEAMGCSGLSGAPLWGMLLFLAVLMVDSGRRRKRAVG